MTVFVILIGMLFFFYNRFGASTITSLMVTDRTATSATIVWVSDKASFSGVHIESSNPSPILLIYRDILTKKNVFWDSRNIKYDENGKSSISSRNKYYTHHIVVENLEPDTEYSFSLINNSVIVNSMSTRTFNTFPVSDIVREPVPVYGKVETSGNIVSEDVIILAQAIDRTTADINRFQSTWVSTPLYSNGYVLDVGGLSYSDSTETFPSVIDNSNLYTIRLLLLTQDGLIEHVVTNSSYQPVDTVVVDIDNFVSHKSNKLVFPAYAKCNSTCVGDCQGCNLPTTSDPLCATYGCGYMSHCCGEGDPVCDGHCSNGKQDCDESGIDCGGGGCKTCTTGGSCTGTTPCVQYGGTACVAKNANGACTCNVNGKKDADETAIDCGGNYCPACTNAGSHCYNRIEDQDEDGVDCGGSCTASCSSSLAALAVGVSCPLSYGTGTFTCADRTDWLCWCMNGKVATYHSKSISVISTTKRSYISQEGVLKYTVNSKFGVHTGIGPFDMSGITDGGQVGYVMNVIGSPDQLDALIAEYQNLPAGVVPIVRFCSDGQDESCPFSDVNTAADFVNQLTASLGGKTVAVISGPNEPLTEPWTVPGGCAADNCTDAEIPMVAEATADWMNEFVSLTGDADNLIQLSPDLNTSEPAFPEFLDAMSNAGANFSQLDGIAGNAYEGAGGTTISGTVDYLKSLGFTDIYITEAGIDPNLQASDPANYEILKSALLSIADDPSVKSMLLFNPTGTNPTYLQHELTPEQYADISQALTGTAMTVTTSSAPGYVVDSDVDSGGGSGNASCGNGTKTTEGGMTCCSGTCLTVCTGVQNGEQKTYVHNSGECPSAGDTFLTSSQKSVPDVVNILPGNYYTISGLTNACVHIHTWTEDTDYFGGTLPPEHEDMCVSSGGAQIGVAAGQGNRILQRNFMTTTYASDETIEPGVYTVNGINVDVTTKTIDVSTDGVLRFYYDINENGIQDDDEPILSDEESQEIEVTLKKNMDVLTYDVIPGWNVVALPLVMESEDTAYIKTASDLLSYLNVAGLEATHVVAYRSHQFIVYSERVNSNGNIVTYGDDFGLIPGEGYFVKVSYYGSFSLAGYLAEDALPVELSVGWNLINLYDPHSTSLTAREALESMQEEDIPVDILATWNQSQYDAYILDGTDEYGQDFPLYIQKAYWVRATSDDSFSNAVFTP